MGRKRGVSQYMMETPVLRNLTFAPLPWQTHPIDLYDGPQGWGPFTGPWTPWDWHDPADAIAYTYGHGESNEWQFAPDYDIITVFGDPSLDWAWNTSYDAVAEQDAADSQMAYTSTIANVVAPSPSLLDRFRSAIGGNNDG